MKKIILLLICIVGFSSLYAQTVPMNWTNPHHTKNTVFQGLDKKRPTRDSVQIFANYLIDEYYLDSFYYAGIPSSDMIRNEITILNSRYDLNDTVGRDLAIIDYAVNAFTTFVDFDLNSDTIIKYKSTDYNGMTIDSIFVAAGWEQNTVNDDTTIVSIVQLNSAGYPTNTVMWSDTMIHSLGSSINNNWLEGTSIRLGPGIHTTQKGFGIKVQEFGDKTDTFGVIYGYLLQTNSACTIQGGARISRFYPNSYAYWTARGALYPKADGTDLLYQDCNNNNLIDSLDDANFIQDLNFGALVTFSLTTGVNQINPDIANSYVYPNPSLNITDLYFTMPNSSSASVLNVYDVTGKIVQSYNMGHQSAGKHLQKMNTADFASGVYMYSIATDHGTTFGKFVKQ